MRSYNNFFRKRGKLPTSTKNERLRKYKRIMLEQKNTRNYIKSQIEQTSRLELKSSQFERQSLCNQDDAPFFEQNNDTPELNEHTTINENFEHDSSDRMYDYVDCDSDLDSDFDCTSPKSKQEEISAALLTLFFSGDFTKTALAKTIELMQLLTNEKLPKTFNQLLTRLQANPIEYSKRWYCQPCDEFVELNNQYQRRCSNENCSENLSAFYYMSISSQLQTLFERNVLPKKKFNYNPEYITDVKDGSIYQEFISSFTDYQANKVHSFTCNTDGASLCDKSSLTMWPFFLGINEIEINSRFSPENIIIGGIFVGHSKPYI
jgi:hypothetical protein